MKRRDILKASAAFLGYSLVGGASIAVLNGCKADTSDNWVPSFFTKDQVAVLSEVAERIIPRTDTPGAKDALVGRYIDAAVKDNFKAEDQEKFRQAVVVFDAKANDKFGKKFVDITDAEKDEIIQGLADLSKDENADELERQIFPGLKSMVVAGFFTSEVGATKVLIYDPVPGPFQGCIPLADVGGVYSLD